MAFDREKFNKDPKHEAERTQFDIMVEDAANRIAASKAAAANKPAPSKGFFDSFFTSDSEEGGNFFDKLFGGK